jgi:prepilin signal peptidase PulO-like enzyme (type II secretory pathway)
MLPALEPPSRVHPGEARGVRGVADIQWEDLWWMLWIGAVGACVGSFLNMLVYRLPRERSLLRPRHSYCPDCESPIAWYDNIPLVSYVALGGRCRHCHVPIPIRYPLIECLCALSFMLIADAFYVGSVRPDLQSPFAFGVTGQVAATWPVLVGHLVMVAALLAVAAMDLEEYYVDVRLTWLIVIVGLGLSLTNGLCYIKAPAVSPTVAGVTVAAAVGLLISWSLVQLWSRLHMGAPEAEWDGVSSGAPANAGQASGPSAGERLAALAERELIRETPQEPRKERSEPSELSIQCSAKEDMDSPPGGAAGRSSPLWGCLLAVLCLLVILLWASSVSFHKFGEPAWMSAPLRLGLAYLALFVALLGASIRWRPADASIIEAIESERGQARRTAIGELMFLSPAVLLGAGMWFWLTRGGGQPATEQLAAMLAWPRSLWWQPLHGLVWALLSMMIAGGIGWATRIVFTLVLGKEALGLGDVHLMWAAGAVVGWGVVVLGFFAGAFLAVIGMILLLGFKRSRAIPFGPWLALGVLLIVLARDPVLRWLQPALEAGHELLTHLTT